MKPTIHARTLRIGARGAEVKKLQALLLDRGFLAGDKGRRHPRFTDILVAGPLLKEPMGLFGDTTQQALSLLQERAGIPVTGELDASTIELLQAPRCDRPDHTRALVLGRRLEISGTRRRVPYIPYRFANLSAKLNPLETRKCIELAMGMWQQVSPIIWEEVGAREHTTIAFATGRHGNKQHRRKDPFDGPSGTLAHAMRRGDYDGDIHFDDDESWWGSAPNCPSDRIDLVSVAAHELGHTLGLDHSPVPSSLMYEFYHPLRSLHSDDISRIQALYGIRDRNLRAALATPSPLTPITAETPIFITGSTGRTIGQPGPFICSDYPQETLMLFKGPQSSPGSVIRDGDTVALKTVRGYWWYVSGIYVIASRNNGDARPYSIFKTTPPDPAKPETLDSIIRHDDLIRLKNLAIWHWGRGDEWVEVAPQHQSFIAAYNAFAGPSKMPSPKPRRSARG